MEKFLVPINGYKEDFVMKGQIIYAYKKLWAYPPKIRQYSLNYVDDTGRAWLYHSRLSHIHEFPSFFNPDEWAYTREEAEEKMVVWATHRTYMQSLSNEEWTRQDLFNQICNHLGGDKLVLVHKYMVKLQEMIDTGELKDWYSTYLTFYGGKIYVETKTPNPCQPLVRTPQEKVPRYGTKPYQDCVQKKKKNERKRWKIG